MSPGKTRSPRPQPARRQKPLGQWTVNELIADFDGPLPARRIDAQDELVRRGASVQPGLIAALQDNALSEAQQTWTAWAMGRIATGDTAIDAWFAQSLSNRATPLNLQLQALRILAFRAHESGKARPLPTIVIDSLRSDEPRIRFEAAQAVWRSKQTQHLDALLALAAKETDRLTFYTAWHALGEFMEPEAL